MASYNAKADKTYQFTYDATGNRLTVSFQSTCGERRRDTTVQADTLADTLMDKALTEIQPVTAPKAYPNLVKDYFILSLPDIQTTARLEIYDMNSLPVYTDNAVTTSHNIIQTCGLAAGSYTVVVYYGSDKPFIQKIIKY